MEIVTRDTDYTEIVLAARRGDQAAYAQLLELLRGYGTRLARQFFLPGASREDVFQEAMAGLVYAVASFEPARGAAFPDYATMCMRNQVVASVRKATRKKYRLLTEAGDLSTCRPVASGDAEPDRIVEARLSLEALARVMRERLSELEFTALVQRVGGVSVREIGELLELPLKTVENALFRARQKARTALAAAA